jgi:hypothetical protein
MTDCAGAHAVGQPAELLAQPVRNFFPAVRQPLGSMDFRSGCGRNRSSCGVFDRLLDLLQLGLIARTHFPQLYRFTLVREGSFRGRAALAHGALHPHQPLALLLAESRQGFVDYITGTGDGFRRQLQSALGKRLEESFQRVTEQFAQVQQAIGQVQNVAGQVLR